MILSNCKYQLILKDFPFYCCKAQKYCPPVICPKNIEECPIYKERNNNCENRN